MSISTIATIAHIQNATSFLAKPFQYEEHVLANYIRAYACVYKIDAPACVEFAKLIRTRVHNAMYVDDQWALVSNNENEYYAEWAKELHDLDASYSYYDAAYDLQESVPAIDHGHEDMHCMDSPAMAAFGEESDAEYEFYN